MANHSRRARHPADTPLRYLYRQELSRPGLAIDAIDLLHHNDIRTYVIVISDADFTGLAIHLRESGCQVHGPGEYETRASFAMACTTFTYLDRHPTRQPATKQTTHQATPHHPTPNTHDGNALPAASIRSAYSHDWPRVFWMSRPPRPAPHEVAHCMLRDPTWAAQARYRPGRNDICDGDTRINHRPHRQREPRSGHQLCSLPATPWRCEYHHLTDKIGSALG
ncbi:NYN domain-containing protein [Nocardia jiangxiensis]|uniref:NYN domain-containing protein n=1 Tax=Nocardia jiangxiensis TaxID=282685 RepID=UPI003570A049